MGRQDDAVDIVVEDSVTKLGPRHRGTVVVAGSHGGIICGVMAARAGVRAVVVNDAGLGKDAAGIAALAALEGIGMAAAAIGHMSARIGDGADMMARGIIGHLNRIAAALGVVSGQACAEAARRLTKAAQPTGEVPAFREARFPLREVAGEPAVWGLDTATLAGPEDRGRILVIGSHGGLIGGRSEAALRAEALAALFNDAGVGADGAGLTRLPALDARAIAAGTVDCMSARIGDARSSWETGILSHVNATAAALGARPGMTVREFAALLAARHRGRGPA